MDLKSVQKPLKDQYRADPDASQITLKARGGQTETPIACSVAIGRQITCQMVATSMGIPVERIEVTVEGDLDLRGTLGISKDVPVGFERLRVRFDLTAPNATPEQLRALREKTEQYCVVMQTLTQPPPLQTDWVIAK